MADEPRVRVRSLETDPDIARDEGEESRLASVVDTDEDDAPVTVIDRADRLAVEHDEERDPAREDEDDERALD